MAVATCKSYSLDYKYPGKYLIFNHYTFDVGRIELSERHGTEHDVHVITQTFEELGFRGQTYNDSTVKHIRNILQSEFWSDTKDFASLFVFILTHGEDGNKLFAKDGHYDVQTLVEDLNFNTPDSSSKKPKFFFIQACRGHEVDQGISESCGSTEEESAKSLFLPTHDDLLLAYAAPPGYISHRDQGSWFIQTLCQTIKQKSHQYDVETIVTVARRIVATQIDYEYKDDKAKLHKQIPLSTTTLTKKFYLTKTALKS